MSRKTTTDNLNDLCMGVRVCVWMWLGCVCVCVKAYLDINSIKPVTNGIDHIVPAEKYTHRF